MAPVVPPIPRTIDQVAAFANAEDRARQEATAALEVCRARFRAFLEYALPLVGGGPVPGH